MKQILNNFHIPTIKELNILLYQYHSKNCHENYNEFKRMFYENKIGFIGMDALL
jgi:hypothetical protein